MLGTAVCRNGCRGTFGKQPAIVLFTASLHRRIGFSFLLEEAVKPPKFSRQP